mgnify:CR=1 FL=1
MEQRQLSARVLGRVQGVGFRHFARAEAERLALTGWVRNEYDGSVQVVAEGPPEKLAQLERALHRGPSYAHVTHVETAWKEASGTFSRFEVRRA